MKVELLHLIVLHFQPLLKLILEVITTQHHLLKKMSGVLMWVQLRHLLHHIQLQLQ